MFNLLMPQLEWLNPESVISWKWGRSHVILIGFNPEKIKLYAFILNFEEKKNDYSYNKFELA